MVCGENTPFVQQHKQLSNYVDYYYANLSLLENDNTEYRFNESVSVNKRKKFRIISVVCAGLNLLPQTSAGALKFLMECIC